MAAKTKFVVHFDAEGVNRAKFRNDITVHMRGPAPASYDLPTDEGPFHGGDGTAPYPLAYFASGLTACTMTQLRAFAKRLRLDLGPFKVDTRLKWQGEAEAGGPYVSAPLSFEMDVDLGNDLPLADRKRLLEAAIKGCFVEAVLQPGLVKHRIKDGAGWVEA